MAIATPEAPEQDTFIDYDANARAYFLALKSGELPETRPDLGPLWTKLAEDIEEKCRRAKGKKEALQRLFATLERMEPSLADLLAFSLQGGVSSEVIVPELLASARLPALASRDACPVLDWYVDFSRKASPRAHESFHAFIGLWLFSTIAARRVYLPIRRKKFYSNLMIALFAETSFFAKSFTAKQAKDVLYACNLAYLLGPNRMTPQYLWSAMSGNALPANYDELEPEKQERWRKRLSMPGQKGLIFDEFGKFVQSMLRKGSTNAEFVDMFLEFDSCPPEYENATVSRGGEPIEKPAISLLGNITPPNLKENARSGADFWTDGFWARFSFVVAPQPTEDMIQEDDDEDDDELPIPQDLIDALTEWHERLGVPECRPVPQLDKKNEPTGKYTIEREELPETACTITPEAKKAYKRYDVALRRMCLKFGHGDFTGSYTRLAETAMRMAVIMASLSNNNQIELRHWAKAQELAELLRSNLHELYARVNVPIPGESQKAGVEDEIIRTLKKHGPLTVAILRGSYLKKRSVDEIETGLRALKRINMVRESQTSHSIRYALVEKVKNLET